MNKETTTIVSWAFWLSLLLLTYLEYGWAENVAVFLVWVLMSLVFLIFFAVVNVQTDAHKKRATIADPFDLFSFGTGCVGTAF